MEWMKLYFFINKGDLVKLIIKYALSSVQVFLLNQNKWNI